jgi:hypothetical protein
MSTLERQEHMREWSRYGKDLMYVNAGYWAYCRNLAVRDNMNMTPYREHLQALELRLRDHEQLFSLMRELQRHAFIAVNDDCPIDYNDLSDSDD